MTDREKLIELIQNAVSGCAKHWAEIIADYLIANGVVIREKGEWNNGECANCHEEAPYTSWDEPIYDYDWEESLQYSHTERHKEYHLTNFCPNCGSDMRGEKK